jgi:transcriptional regulator with XRE-family HTH domain
MDERKIVKKIQELRLQKQFTLQKLADETDLTKGYLSIIESVKKSPPIATLSKIARALNVDITDFFSQKKPEDHITLVRKGDRVEIAAHGTAFGYDYESIAPAKIQKMMEPFVIAHPVILNRPGLTMNEKNCFLYHRTAYISSIPLGSNEKGFRSIQKLREQQGNSRQAYERAETLK